MLKKLIPIVIKPIKGKPRPPIVPNPGMPGLGKPRPPIVPNPGMPKYSPIKKTKQVNKIYNTY